MKYLIFVLNSFLVISCSKIGPTAITIEGRVIDVVSGEPISDLEIIIREERFTISGPETRDIATLISDENGEFEDSFSARLSRSYRCFIDLNTPNLFTGLRDAGMIDTILNNGEDNSIEFRTTFSGAIQENIINVDCDPSIILEITRENSVQGAINNRTFQIENCETLIRKNPFKSPYGQHFYTCRTLRDGVVLTENRDSFYLEIGERKEFTIEW